MTADGFETTLQVNVLAPFLLTSLLLPRLLAGGYAYDAPPSRIINLTSADQSEDVDLRNLTFERCKYDGRLAYEQVGSSPRVLLRGGRRRRTVWRRDGFSVPSICRAARELVLECIVFCCPFFASRFLFSCFSPYVS